MNGTQKIDQLIQDHFMEYMNGGPEEMNEYMMSPDLAYQLPDEMPEIKVTELTPEQVASRESTRLKLTDIELTPVKKPAVELTLKSALDLNPYAFKLLIFLNVVTGEHDSCQASLQVIADGAGLTRETCRRAVVCLKESGYLHLVKRDQKLGNIYRVKKVI